jgi:hypothetical protein
MFSTAPAIHEPANQGAKRMIGPEIATDGPTSDIVAIGPILDRIERRLENSRSFGRDIDELFKQLWQLVNGAWPTASSESVVAACRIIRLASLWQERVETAQRTIALPAEFALSRLVDSLHQLGTPDDDVASVIARSWHNCSFFDRGVLTTILLRGLPSTWHSHIEDAFARERLRVQSAPGAIVHRGPAVALQLLAAGREHTLFLARLRSMQGRLDEALALLEREVTSDVRVIETAALVLAEHGRHEDAIERLRRAQMVSSTPERIRERILELSIERGDIEGATEQTLALVEDTREIIYWHVLSDYLTESAPEKLGAVREQLRARSPSLHVEILMTEGAHDAVAEAIASGKAFSFDQLWRAADFLAPARPEIAARVYERALTLQGALAQSRGECAELANRMQSVGPFFDQLQRPTKLRRIAVEILGRSRNNIPLRREMERVFGSKL